MFGKTQDIPNYSSNETYKALLYTASALSKGAIRKLTVGANGFTAAAIADDTTVYKVVVAAEDIEAGTQGLFYMAGPCVATVPSGNYTAANGLHVLNGAVADSGAAAELPNGVTSQNDFAYIVTGGTSVTSVTITLYPSAITGQT